MNIFSKVSIVSNSKASYFPAIISGYSFVKRFGVKKHYGPYFFAIYEDINGDKVFVKKWFGEKKDLAYSWIKNEISVYSVLGSNTKIGDFNTPKMLYFEESKKSVYLVLEYKKGVDLSSLSQTQKAKIYLKSIEYLEQLYEKFRKNLNKKIPKRPPLYWALILPIITILAVYNHPKKSLQIIKKALFVTFMLPSILFRQKRTLVHRDFNQYNVLLCGEIKCLIDFQLLCVSDPLVEIAIMIMKFYKDKQLLSIIVKYLKYKAIATNHNDLKALSIYLIIMSIYDLSLVDGDHDNSILALNNGLKLFNIL